MKTPFLLVSVATALSLSSCAPSADPTVRNNRIGGAAVGTAAGAVLGNNIDGLNSWGGAAVGGVVGGVLGDTRGKAESAYRRQGPYPYGNNYGYYR